LEDIITPELSAAFCIAEKYKENEKYNVNIKTLMKKKLKCCLSSHLFFPAPHLPPHDGDLNF
jgi:hypothetical protein